MCVYALKRETNQISFGISFEQEKYQSKCVCECSANDKYIFFSRHFSIEIAVSFEAQTIILWYDSLRLNELFLWENLTFRLFLFHRLNLSLGPMAQTKQTNRKRERSLHLMERNLSHWMCRNGCLLKCVTPLLCAWIAYAWSIGCATKMQRPFQCTCLPNINQRQCNQQLTRIHFFPIYRRWWLRILMDAWWMILLLQICHKSIRLIMDHATSDREKKHAKKSSKWKRNAFICVNIRAFVLHYEAQCLLLHQIASIHCALKIPFPIMMMMTMWLHWKVRERNEYVEINMTISQCMWWHNVVTIKNMMCCVVLTWWIIRQQSQESECWQTNRTKAFNGMPLNWFDVILAAAVIELEWDYHN